MGIGDDARGAAFCLWAARPIAVTIAPFAAKSVTISPFAGEPH
ncbi:MAG: hypothetical protein NVV83_24810 [Afipia sp.]|jgi:hypothetical protein|nr:hypothetical protein [Afipia sp.]